MKRRFISQGKMIASPENRKLMGLKVEVVLVVIRAQFKPFAESHNVKRFSVPASRIRIYLNSYLSSARQRRRRRRRSLSTTH